MSWAVAAEADPFPTAFAFETPVGRAVVVRLAAAEGAGRDAILAALHPEERRLAEAMRGGRLVSSPAAGSPPAAPPAPMRRRSAPRTAHRAAPAASSSISHSRFLAVALVGDAGGPQPGIDLEALASDPSDHLLAERIVAAEEHAADRAGAALPVVVRLSLKEAAFKAVHPLLGVVPLRRILAFAGPDGAAELGIPATAVRLTATIRYVEGHVLCIVAATSGEAARRTESSAPAASPIGIQKVSHIQSVGVRTRS